MRSLYRALVFALLLFASPAYAYQMATGEYTTVASPPDNRDITISPAFQPDLVIIKCLGSSEVVWSIPAMGADQSTTFSNTATPVTNRIQAFNADGFEIGTSTIVQPASSTCYYAAFATDAHNDFAVGTYTGDGVDGHDVTISPAFSPQMVITRPLGAASESAAWRSTAHTGDDSSRFAASLANAANIIQAFNADGFEVGTHAAANSNGISYAYIAFKAVSTYNDTGSFAGNTSDLREIASINTPTFGFIRTNRSTASGVACGRWGGVAGDSSWRVDATAPTTNQIQEFNSTGFQVGTAICANDNGNTMYWWMTKTPAYAAARPRLRSIQ